MHQLFAILLTIALLLTAATRVAANAADAPPAAIELEKQALALYSHQRFAEAEAPAKRSLEMLEAALPPDDVHLGEARENLAMIYESEHRDLDAARLYEQALPVWEKVLGHDSKEFAAHLAKTGLLYQQLEFLDKAEPLLRRALAINEAALPAESPVVGKSLADLALVYLYQREFRKAESMLKRAISIMEKTPVKERLEFGFLLRGLADSQQALAHLADAERSFRRAIAVLEAVGGPNDQFLPKLLDDLASLYQDQGRYVDAEPLERRSLDIIISNGAHPDDPALASGLNNLATLLSRQGRIAEAKQLFERSMDIQVKAGAAGNPEFAISMGNLAVVLSTGGDVTGAESLLKRAQSTLEQQFGDNQPPAYITILHSLGTLYFQAGRYAEAEPVMLRAINMSERLGMRDNLSSTLNNLGNLYLVQGRYAEAERKLRKSLHLDEEIFGENYRGLLFTLTNLAAVYRATGQTRLAYEHTKRAVRIIRSDIAAESASEYGRREGVLRDHRGVVLQFIIDANALPKTPAAERQEGVEAALEAAQILQVAEAAHAVAQMSARLSAGTDALASDIRQREAGFLRWRDLEEEFVASLSHPTGPNRASVTATLQQQVAQARANLERLDARIARDDPRYAELSSLTPVSVADTKSLLGPDEALLVYTVGIQDVWLWVVKREAALMFHLDINAATMSDDVRSLRASLDPSQGPPPRRFDVGLANALYDKILAPAAPLLDGVSHVIVVPDGALQSLPLGVLVRSLPPPIVDPTDYRRVHWFARSKAISVLPAVSSLRALRQVAGPSLAKRPFVGIGAPTLRRCREGITIAGLSRGSAVDVDAVRRLCALPQATEELQALARSLGASPDNDVYTGDRATLSVVRSLQLASYRVIAFATHGLVAGGPENLIEPALVLTPPIKASADDYGLLTASEVSQLKLDSDWVILSACNTAEGEATGAEGLSSLARAFFYAGARSLLVSHWSVNSVAADELTTTTLYAMANDPTLGRAEALRRAEMKMLDEGNPEMAHPSEWAPFVLVGIGSRMQ